MKTLGEFIPETEAELGRYLAENAKGEKHPVYPQGGRTAQDFGFPVSEPGLHVSTDRLDHIVDYPARDLTITVGSGMRVSALAEIVAAEGQHLPIDVSQPRRATIGGAVATNMSGPRRFHHGTFRDYVIGIRACDAAGVAFKGGGRVVKNVAGYDLCKMLVGSLGTLGIITELTLKLKPIPEATGLVWASFEKFAEIEHALEALGQSQTRPVSIDVLNTTAARHVLVESRQSLGDPQQVLAIGFEGTRREIDWQFQTLQSELAAANVKTLETITDDDATAVLLAITEYRMISDDPLTFRANLRPSRVMEFIERASNAGSGILAQAGNGICIGHLPDNVVTVEKADEALKPLRKLAGQSGGGVSVLSCDDVWKPHLDMFGPQRAEWTIMKQLKQTIDPHNLLNRGRYWLDAPSPAS